MHMHRIGATAHKARSAWVLIAGLGFLLAAGAGGASAQTPSTPPTGADGAPSEALRRQALSPYRFILQHANAPARKPSPAAAPAAAAAAPEPRRPAAPAPIEQAAVQPRPAPAATAATATPAAPEPVPRPTPVATLMPKPTEPEPIAAVRREIIPVRTDEPRLPAALLRERPSGLVRVQFDVNPDGSTGGVKVLSSTNRALNRVTIDAVGGWKFQPVDEVMTVETELAYKYD